MKRTSISIDARTQEDTLIALEEITRLISIGFTSGNNRNTDGRFIFESAGEYEDEGQDREGYTDEQDREGYTDEQDREGYSA